MDFDTEWSDGIPEGYNQSQAIPQFKQHLYERWKRGEEPCQGCPNWVMKESCEPSFGSGSHKADILLVGSAPGPRKRSLELSNKGRTVDAEKLENLSSFKGEPLCAFYDSRIGDLKDWQGLSTLRKRFIEDQRGLNTDLEDGRIYFTNAKKCSNIEGKDNEGALAKCGEYLTKEINLINPDVIVTWGRMAAVGTARCLDYDIDKLPRRAMSLPSGDVQPTDSVIGYRDTNPELITMPHWALLGPNTRHIPDFNPNNYNKPARQIYFELADLVKHILGDDRTD